MKFNLPKEALMEVEGLPFKKVSKGKVRENFDLGDELLIVATDRISAFDVIMPNGVPGKGILLTQISLWWFKFAAEIMPTHIVPDHDARVRELLKNRPELIERSMIVKKLKPMPIEAIVRGYLTGSGWKEYERTGKLFEFSLPAGMGESQKLPAPLFTPTTKAAEGHDMPITNEECAAILGEDAFSRIKRASIALYEMGAKKAAECGIILADTKFEFGADSDGKAYLIDEVLTPDSSRYWPADKYEVGRSQPSYDKQYVRDWLENLGWDKRAPGPVLPPDVVANTISCYGEALDKLMK
ncbi:MAG: phosphoribosylaminoimidazolesuccinocarboxamide synthase [Verrucomicrobia bacterium]|nr:MAG: phosphoribosylaminoimidazolesuccinocarboxamide synthase [Verrucomicrobiota bacterium]